MSKLIVESSKLKKINIAAGNIVKNILFCWRDFLMAALWSFGGVTALSKLFFHFFVGLVLDWIDAGVICPVQWLLNIDIGQISFNMIAGLAVSHADAVSHSLLCKKFHNGIVLRRAPVKSCPLGFSAGQFVHIMWTSWLVDVF